MVDNKHEIICPACGKLMKKIFISRLNINLDICLDGCGGIYFDNQELKKFDNQNESINEILEVIEGKTFREVDENKTRVCPVCMANMIKNFASPNKGVTIDECYSCGGKFLDFGELQRLHNETENKDEMTEKLLNGLYAASKQSLKTINSEFIK